MGGRHEGRRVSRQRGEGKGMEAGVGGKERKWWEKREISAPQTKGCIYFMIRVVHEFNNILLNVQLPFISLSGLKDFLLTSTALDVQLGISEGKNTD